MSTIGKGVRVVEGARLESVLWVTPYAGSNPALSVLVRRIVASPRLFITQQANMFIFIALLDFLF